MKFSIPKIIKPLRLAEYEAAYGDATISVWVNPHEDKINEYIGYLNSALEAQKALVEAKDDTERATATAQLEEIAVKIQQWLSEIWSQGEQDTRWSAEEIDTLYKNTTASDPQLWPWLSGNTLAMILDYRRNRKKALRRAS